MFFEELLRRFFVFAFGEIARTVNDPDVTFIDELFSSWGDEVRLQVKKWFVESTNINVSINFPKQDIGLPFVCVVNSNESEAAQAYLGDYGGHMMLGADQVTASSKLDIYGDVDNRPRGTQVRRLLSVPETKTTQIFIGTNDVNTTLYLYTVVKALLLMNKIDFDKRGGARNLKVSGSDLQYHQELWPEFAYFKQLTLNYETNFDVALPPEDTIKGVNLTLSDFFDNQLNP